MRVDCADIDRIGRTFEAVRSQRTEADPPPKTAEPLPIGLNC